MTYLFGDSTPFPLKENLLEVLKDLTDACVSLVQIDEGIQNAQQRQQRVVGETEHDQKWLADLGEAVLATITHRERRETSPLVATEVDRLAETTRRFIDNAQATIGRRREALLEELASDITAKRRSVRAVLEQFLLRHVLPDTTWGIVWKASEDGQAASAEAVAVAACGLEGSFDLDIPASHPWSKAVRVGEIAAELSIELPCKPGLLRRQQTRRESLAKSYITGVDLSPERLTLVIHRRLKDPRGFEITRSGEDRHFTVAAVGEEAGFGHHAIDGEDGAVVRALFNEVARGLHPLTTRRSSVRELALGDAGLVEAPAQLAKMLIGTVAPFVREIRRRGSTGEELCLKRQISDDRREEIFLPVKQITDKLEGLPPKTRALFGALGLGDEGPDENEITQPSGLAAKTADSTDLALKAPLTSGEITTS